MNIEKLKEEIKNFCEARDWDQFHGIKDLCIGVATEAAELLEIFRFQSEKQSESLIKDKKKKEVSDELADVLFFVLRIAQKYDIDLADAFRKKMKKNKEKYPVEKARGSNKKYNELLE
jgi:NTP pyrophosphatase (non-canonical NTP hydrolase)